MDGIAFFPRQIAQWANLSEKLLLTCQLPMYILLERSKSSKVMFILIFVQNNGGSYDMGE
jgi:hypothetical protein